MLSIIKFFTSLVVPLAAPSSIPVKELPSDGRRFAWVYAPQYEKAGGQKALVPVILFDKEMCGEKRLNIVVSRVLLSSEYGESLDVFAIRYPAP